MTVTVRFAPSPTGLIHIGNARTAVLNWLFARKHGGRFILRFDDTDRERSKPEFAAAIERDLDWLGIRPDLVVHQSGREALYRGAAERLKATGALYACYETPEELEGQRRRQLARRQPPVYDRTGLGLDDAARARLEAEGRRPYWRFRLARAEVSWSDLIRGETRIDTAALSDPVLVRDDGSFLYTLTSVVDDIDLGVSHVIRGEDHVTNAAVQIELFRALGAEPPAFAHHPLLIGAGGESLSKRLGTLSLQAMRAAGHEAMAVASLAALIGTSEAIEPHADMAGLVESFDLARLSRAPARFAMADLDGLDAKLLHRLDHAAVRDRLAGLGAEGGEAFWLAVRGNLARLAEAAEWHAIVFGDEAGGAPDEAEAAFLAAAAELLPDEPWDEATWAAWTARIQAATGRKGRALYLPLRRALTGRDQGPELARLLPLLGRKRALKRLSG